MLVALAVAAGSTGLVVTSATGVARADTRPVSPATPPTVSADVLPTVQVDGVVWSQVVVGTTVYVTGSFATARPAGAAPGAQHVTRSNLLAYDVRTGRLVTSWAPSLNAQGRAIAASRDGATIYVAGDFTTVDGVRRSRLAAISARTGKLVTSFSANTNARVDALAVDGGLVYLGGIFSVVKGHPRSRIAAVTEAGALTGWAPTADAEVMAITAPHGSGKVVVGGRFTHLDGAESYGMGALSRQTGEPLPWQATSVVRDAGPRAAIYSLTSDAHQVYGTGYTFGSGGNFESVFAAAASDGALAWVSGCRGDTYGAAVAGPVVYTVSHAHDCSAAHGFGQGSPTWNYQRAMAWTTTPAADGRTNAAGSFAGRPVAEILHWLPTLTPGTVTGQKQAAWTVTATKDYVLLGGEFPKVDGVRQQGLARFAISTLAPDKQGPQGTSSLGLAVTGTGTGTVSATWTAAWDRDNARLTYELLRGPTLRSAVVAASTTVDSTWWNRPQVSLSDGHAPAGETAAYRLRVTDPLGNAVVGPAVTVSVPTG